MPFLFSFRGLNIARLAGHLLVNMGAEDFITMYQIICSWISREGFTPGKYINKQYWELFYISDYIFWKYQFISRKKVSLTLPVSVCSNQTSLIDDTKSILCCICRNHIHDPNRMLGHSSSKATKTSTLSMTFL